MLTKEVELFYPYWTPVGTYTSLPYYLISTIVIEYVRINADASITLRYVADVNSVISTAHSNGTKVVLMFLSASAIATDTVISDPALRATAIDNIYNEVVAKGFDGVDNDIEGMNVTNSITGQPNKGYMTSFCQELSTKFWNANPNYRLSLDVDAYYPNTDARFDLPTIQSYLNFVMPMCYDWYGSWSSTVGPNSPHLLDPGNCTDDSGNYCSILHFKSEMSANKILFGVPWFGYEFQCDNNTRLSTRPVGGTVTEILYKDYVTYVDSYNPTTDSVWKTPWYARLDVAQWYQGHYDDLQSLGQKHSVVKSQGLAGVGLFEVSASVGRTDLWNLIKTDFFTDMGATLTL